VQPNGSKGSCALVNTTAVAVNQGPGRTNLIAVEADASTLVLYVNHTSVDTVTDTRFTSGNIGVFAAAYRVSAGFARAFLACRARQVRA
jgi:hypothetical protein